MINALAHCFKFSYKCHKFERNKNYYDILKIQFGCSKSGIRVAYLGLAKKYHPDVNPKQKQHFTLIQEAYQVLSNEKHKQEYDQFHSANFVSSQKNIHTQTNRKTNYSDHEYKNQKYQYDKKHEQFKGQQGTYQYYNNNEPDLKKQRQKWSKQFYDYFGMEQVQKPIKKKVKTELDQQYQKMQYNFSNKNPFSPMYKKQQVNSEDSFRQFWQDIKTKLNK